MNRTEFVTKISPSRGDVNTNVANRSYSSKFYHVKTVSDR